MKKILLAGVAALAIAGSTVVYAQHRPWFHEHMRMSPEDRAAFADARIAAVHAGLKLTPDQEKLWPPVETAVRDFAKMRIDRANARMNAKSDDQGCAAAGRSGGAAAPARRQHGDLGGGAEEDRRCGRSALQDPGRRPEAPAQDPDPYGTPVRRRRRLAAPRIARHGSRSAAGIVATTASGEGSRRPRRLRTALTAAALRPIESAGKAAGIRRLFRRSAAARRWRRENSAGLLDIAGSLC